MSYEPIFEKANVSDYPETRGRKPRLDLPVCGICRGKLAGYSLEQPSGRVLQVCRSCLLEELGQ